MRIGHPNRPFIERQTRRRAQQLGRHCPNLLVTQSCTKRSPGLFPLDQGAERISPYRRRGDWPTHLDACPPNHEKMNWNPERVRPENTRSIITPTGFAGWLYPRRLSEHFPIRDGSGQVIGASKIAARYQ